MKEWKGLMKVQEFQHLDAEGKVLYKEEGIKNLIHHGGEELVLKVLFGGQAVPQKYYIGLDSRTSLVASNSIANISGFEPTTNSYERQPVDSNNFSLVNGSAGWQANSPVLLFKATGGVWGPVRNIFMASGIGHSASSTLISSASLSRDITVSAGEIITMRMAMALSDG